MANTPHRTIRVEEDLWRAFGDACEALGSTRTEALIGCMRRYVVGAGIIVGRSTEPITDGQRSDSAA